MTFSISNSDELVPVFNGPINGFIQPLVDARTLHTFLEVGKVFAAWINERIEQYIFLENQDFICFPILESKGRGGHNRIEYHITLNMAKELAMVERTKKGQRVRRYFIECERKLHERPQYQDFHSDLLSIAKAAEASAKTIFDAAQSLANTVRALVDKYASHAITEQSPNALSCQHIVNCEQRTQPQLPSPTTSTLTVTSQVQPCADVIFLAILWEVMKSQPFTASELFHTILTRQHPTLSDAAIELLGDTTTWTARKLGQSLGRWSRSEVSCYRVLNTGPSKNGILWRLERVS